MLIEHNGIVPWEVEFTDEFEEWWDGPTESEQDKIDDSVGLLEKLGPHVPFPHSSGVDSRHSHMRELRVQIHGQPFRVLYAFDPMWVSILLLGGDKTGDDRWYETKIPEAEKLYDRHLAVLKKEKGI